MLSHDQVGRVLRDRLDNTSIATTYTACEDYLRIILEALNLEDGVRLVNWAQDYLEDEANQ